MTDIGEIPQSKPETSEPQAVQKPQRTSSIDYIRKAQSAVKMNEMANRDLVRSLRERGKTETEIEEAMRPVTVKEQQQFAEGVSKSRRGLLNRGLFRKVFSWFEGD